MSEMFRQIVQMRPGISTQNCKTKNSEKLLENYQHDLKMGKNDQNSQKWSEMFRQMTK